MKRRVKLRRPRVLRGMKRRAICAATMRVGYEKMWNMRNKCWICIGGRIKLSVHRLPGLQLVGWRRKTWLKIGGTYFCSKILSVRNQLFSKNSIGWWCDDAKFYPGPFSSKDWRLIMGSPLLPKQSEVFWSDLPSLLTSCCMGGRLTCAGLKHKTHHTSALCTFLLILCSWKPNCWPWGIIVLESFNTPNLQSPLKESDNLPQVGRTQTSPAAKLILNSALTRRLLQDLRIVGTFPFPCGFALHIVQVLF